MRFSTIILFTMVLIGICSRLYLAYILPVWHDEIYSIWASTTSLSSIATGVTDPVHPPGYYLVLKFWSSVSLHLYWLRFLSILFFVINCFLFYLIGKRLQIQKDFPLYLVSVYVLSGYFLIFDWQVRMYAGLLTCILTSLLLLRYLTEKIRSTRLRLILLTLANSYGLYFDYGFLWYFIPLLAYYTIIYIKTRDNHHGHILLSLLGSLTLFIAWYPDIFRHFHQGISGITWTTQYLSPLFVIPFLTGTHTHIMFTCMMLVLIILGLYSVYVYRKAFYPLPYIGFITAVGVCVLYVVSLLSTPLFHVRSIQIIPIILIFLTASSISLLRQKKHKLLLFISYEIILINFVSNFLFLPQNPEKFLITIFPWKSVRQELVNAGYTRVEYIQTHELPTPLLLWGFTYTLDGYETLPIKRIPHSKVINSNTDNRCTLILNSLLEIYGCDK